MTAKHGKCSPDDRGSDMDAIADDFYEAVGGVKCSADYAGARWVNAGMALNRWVMWFAPESSAFLAVS